MIDKVELRISAAARFTPAVHAFIRQFPYGNSHIRPSRLYAAVADLRPLGIDALLHVSCKHGSHDHKIEMLDTGKKVYSELVQQIEFTCEADPMKLSVTRLDLCADVPGTPVAWFQPRIRVKFKRFANEIGVPKYEQMGNRRIETLVAGKRPNVFRIYDKVAECKVQFDKLRRRTSPDADPLEFETEFGFAPDAVLTRVERQCGGGRVPPDLNTFGKLASAPAYNPFEPLEIISGSGSRLPSVEDCHGVSEWLCGTMLNQLANEWGMQPLRAWLNRNSPGNAARLLEKHKAFLPKDGETDLTSVALYEIYRESVTRQLAA